MKHLEHKVPVYDVLIFERKPRSSCFLKTNPNSSWVPERCTRSGRELSVIYANPSAVSYYNVWPATFSYAVVER